MDRFQGFAGPSYKLVGILIIGHDSRLTGTFKPAGQWISDKLVLDCRNLCTPVN